MREEMNRLKETSFKQFLICFNLKTFKYIKIFILYAHKE